MARKQIVVAGREEEQRLDGFLLKKFPALSRKSCRDFISASTVLVNGSRARKGRRLRAGDVVSVEEGEIERWYADFAPSPSARGALEVLYRDEALLAADKPPGVDCAPIRKSDTGTLISAAVALEPSLGRAGGWKRREPGLLYRLDRDVSGVVLFALDVECFNRLAEASMRDEIRKTYLAVVENPGGELLETSGTAVAFGPRCRGQGRRARQENVSFRPGETLEESIEKIAAAGRTRAALRAQLAFIRPVVHAGSASLLEVQITRALRHQIRSILSALGHPVAGDALYGAAPPGKKAGLMLHCWRIRFPHPRSRKQLTIESPPGRILEYHQAFAGRKDASF